MHNTKRFTTVEDTVSYYERVVKIQFIAWFIVVFIITCVYIGYYIPLQFKWNNLDKVGQQHAMLYDKWKQAHLATIKEFEEAMTVEEQKYAKFEAVLKTTPQPEQTK